VVDRADLEAAAAAGIIGADRVEPLFEFLARRALPANAVSGEEDLRFIRNFHDVFLATGITLFAVGLTVATGVLGGENALFLLGLVLLGGGVLWVLAEVFAGRRRQFLPSIALCISLSVFGACAGGLVVTLALGATAGLGELLTNRSGDDQLDLSMVMIGATLAFAATALAFYARFRLPFAIGLAGAGGAGVVLTLLYLATRDTGLVRWALLPCGLALFAAGVAFDARDPSRATRFSDNGFWLHVAAAPLILNGALTLVGGRRFDADLAQAVVTLIVVGVLGLVSLAINRRALVVSALVTTGIAIGIVMNATGLGEGALIAGTLVTLGGFVLVIGASWHVMRRALLRLINPTGLLSRIIPPEAPA